MRNISFCGLTFWLATLLLVLSETSIAQGVVRGEIKDQSNGDPLIAANVVVKGTTVGTTTDFDGKFELKVNETPPFQLVISYLGYEETEISVANFDDFLKIELKESGVILSELVVKESRITEKQKETPLTVESLDIIAIKETAAANFYDGLGALKGVDLTAASLGFKVINTRGFNSTSPVRSLQLIDGVDNQAPGLNFALGNFLGASELDLQRVEIIAGASGAIYGPNAFNGVISMTTKDPFFHQGFSGMFKVAQRDMFETNLRYAKAFKNSSGNDKFAFKLNFSYMRARDWEATNYAEAFQDRENPEYVGVDNLGGYNAVNIYGDENSEAFDGLQQLKSTPGLGTVYRTGYQEKDLVDYDSKNLKLSAALHYNLSDQVRLKYGYNLATGTTVYQGENRYSLKGILFQQHQLELSQKNKFFIRLYHTRENAGDSYDAVTTAVRLQEKALPPENNLDPWFKNYEYHYLRLVIPQLRRLPGMPALPASNSTLDSVFTILDSFPDSLSQYHQFVRDTTDDRISINGPSFYEVGTAQFEEEFKNITTTSFTDGGSRFEDQSSLTHFQAQYSFAPGVAKFTVGANARLFTPNSNGTIFRDTSGVKIRNFEFGLYTAIEKRLLDEQLILTATARLDKNENFPFLLSPAASAVYKLDENKILRLSFSSAIRNPTLQDQFLFFEVGRAKLVGNIDGRDSLVTVSSYLDEYLPSPPLVEELEYFSVPPIVPEKVRSIEVGFKGSLFNNVFVDASYYHSWYQDFIGYKLGLDVADELDPGFQILPVEEAYRVSANADEQVRTQGFSIGINYFLGKYYAFNGNYSWNQLVSDVNDPIIPAYNTPEHKFNIGFSGRDIQWNLGGLRLKNWGFNVNYKWVDGFLFEGSPQFTGFVPSYTSLDAQINYTRPKWHTTFKFGGSNILNDLKFQTYGGPFIGRLMYFSVSFDFDKL